MRRDGFTSRSLGWVEHYGMNDQDSMLAYVGPDRCVLDPRWNVLPIIEDVEDPRLIHWASLSKPWEPRLTQGQARWQTYATACGRGPGRPRPAYGVREPAGGVAAPTRPGGPQRMLVPEDVERVIRGVLAENLGYLGRRRPARPSRDRPLSLEADGSRASSS